MTQDIYPGKTFPLGASVVGDGVNFSVYSKTCQALELLLFDHAEDARPSRIITFDPDRNHRTFHYWHMYVPGLKAGQIYAYRAYGPMLPHHGLRFDSTKILLDPYGRAVAVPDNYDRDASARPGPNTATAMKSVVTNLGDYDWEGDTPINRRFAETVIYEMHVGGFTRHASSEVAKEKRGTYAGLIEKIPYLLDLGVTAVELMPVFHFDEQEAPLGLTNYWGYNPVSFFAPHVPYCSTNDPLAAIDEFRDMVKALHRAGIEVVLDVVYNHTAEGNELGPTFCFKGIDNTTYYTLEANLARYANYSGTGNTLNANHAVVRRLIHDSLTFWVEEMHVDGFRFDLAAVLSRDLKGRPMPNPPILWDIETSPYLSGTKLIAEAWDAAGLYQVGNFFGDHWKEWNGHFRDDVRAFLKGDDGYVEKVASRFFASPDIYGHDDREAEQSINFVTCHDGFTLNDLVSYNLKHNEANNEGNRDGHDYNLSWNCGIEGPTDDPEIEAIRKRQIKNFLTINLLALGVPMLLMGDEVRRTQRGNNNAYCQNNALSWFDWTLVKKHPDILRFTRKLIRFRRSLPVPERDASLAELLHRARIKWHGVELDKPDWGHHSHSIAFTLGTRRERFHVIINAYWKPLEFEIPIYDREAYSGWKRIIDTQFDSPDDFCDPESAEILMESKYSTAARSVVVLMSEP